MSQIISITSQGQISIPVRMRRALGLDKGKKAIIRKEEDKIIIEPAGDILKLGGILYKHAFRNKSIKEIMKIEKEAVRNRWAGK